MVDSVWLLSCEKKTLVGLAHGAQRCHLTLCLNANSRICEWRHFPILGLKAAHGYFSVFLGRPVQYCGFWAAQKEPIPM